LIDIKEIQMSTGKIIHEFQKSAGEKIVTQFREYKGRRLLDIRVFFLSGEGEEELWLPTKKGISIRPELLDELKQAISLADTEHERQLLGPGKKGESDPGANGEEVSREEKT
jgi:hypothetical protein